MHILANFLEDDFYAQTCNGRPSSPRTRCPAKPCLVCKRKYFVLHFDGEISNPSKSKNSIGGKFERLEPPIRKGTKTHPLTCHPAKPPPHPPFRGEFIFKCNVKIKNGINQE